MQNYIKLAVIPVVVAISLIGSQATAQKVTTQSNGSFDFASHKRYAWRPNHLLTKQGPRNDRLIDQKIVEEAGENLTGKGFIEDPANPDFFIHYEAGASELNADFEGAPMAPAPRLNEPQLPVYGIPQYVWYSVDGHITFYLVDAKSNQPIWTARATKKIRDPHKAMKDVDKQVAKIVSAVFKSFPPRAK